ncbi:MAG: RNA recognition motif domain-containing protein [Nitrospirota bacterium]
MGKKIYVGNVSYKATPDDIKTLFEQFGAVASVNMITDSYTGQAKGFGFVEMESEEAAQKAIASLNGSSFMERTLSVAEAKPQQHRERSGRGGFGGKGGGMGRGGRR